VQLETDAGLRLVSPAPERTTHSLAVHPAQLYSALDGLLLTLLLLAFDPLKRRDGETFALLLSVHAVSRFLLEIVRIDEPSVFGTGLSISQNISIGMLAAGIGLFVYLERHEAPRRKGATLGGAMV
jgi:phosphatidylglycerol:prolipoprotein diacylglycerol transferase